MASMQMDAKKDAQKAAGARGIGDRGALDSMAPGKSATGRSLGSPCTLISVVAVTPQTTARHVLESAGYRVDLGRIIGAHEQLWLRSTVAAWSFTKWEQQW